MYCGIDVSKDKSDVCIIDNDKNVVEQCIIEHNKEGFEKLSSLLTSNAKVGMESTGAYSEALRQYLLKEGYEVLYVDTNISKTYAQLRRPNIKNDKSDALMLAHYIAEGLKTNEYVNLTELKDLSRLYFKTLKAVTKYKLMYRSELATIFPELEHHFSIYHTINLPSILIEYPTPKRISAATPEELYAIVKRNNPKSSVGMSFIQRLQRVASESIGADKPTTAFVEITKMMMHYVKSIESIKLQMEEGIKKTPYAKLLDEYGYGITGLATIVGEIADVRRFPNHKKFVSYCGFSISETTSGKSINKQSFTTKSGNRILRNHFYNLVLMNISKKRPLEKFYRHLRNQGKHPKKAMIATARKIAVKTYFDMMKCHVET